MKACLDLHDFSVINNRLLWLLSLKSHFPNFKVSLFTVPVDKKEDWGPYLLRNDFLSEIKKNLDWIQIIPHGLYHEGSEVKRWTYEDTKNNLELIDGVFKMDELPYVKGFCAPHWRWNSEVVRALDDMGWWGAVDPRQPDMVSTKKFYKYSHAIDAELPLQDLKLHGHVYGTHNDLGLCFDNLLKLPLDTEWHWVTDFLEDL